MVARKGFEMNASIITALPTPLAAPARTVPAGVRATRRSGVMAGAEVAVAATLVAMLFGAPYLALGIPAAMVTGFWLGPRVRSPGPIVGVGLRMAALTVVVADAMLVVGV